MRAAPRAVVQPPNPSSRALAHTLQGWLVLPGFSEPLPAASGQVCGRNACSTHRRGRADGLGLTLL